MVPARPLLVSVSGLPGSGKSTLCRRLASALPAVWLRIDSIEQAIREAHVTADPVGEAGYRAAHAIASDNLRNGLSAISDCVNPWMLTRDGWRDTAQAAGADVVEVEIVCSDLVQHRARVEGRSPDVPNLRLPDWAAVLGRDYHPWTRPCLRVDTAGRSVAAAFDDLRRLILSRAA